MHKPLDPQQVYVVRITLLLGELFPLFYAALMRFNASDTESGNAPCIQIGRQLFRLEEVVLNNDDPSGWTSFPACCVAGKISRRPNWRMWCRESLSSNISRTMG